MDAIEIKFRINMGKITVDILKIAFRKLLASTYYDKTNMVMRYHVATFAKSLFSKNEENRIFNNLLNVAEGKNNELLEKWLHEISLSFYPKKLSAVDELIDNIEHGNVITNMPPCCMKVERLIVKANMPAELCILDVAWLLSYGFRVDRQLYKHSYGNRLDLTADGRRVRSGNALFRKYQAQYKGWWENGVEAANQKRMKM